jgi:aerobic-type carbon monoxide dehydrogenase small subunit (CoxS/CutS family)
MTRPRRNARSSRPGGRDLTRLLRRLVSATRRRGPRGPARSDTPLLLPANATSPQPQPRSLHVNGADTTVLARPTTTLLEVLRNQLRLTGTKEACGRGECGACTVLVGGRTVNACMTLAALTGGEVETIEGLTEETADLRRRFADHGAFQCGFCTPGQLVRAVWLARHRADPDPARVRAELAGNICRCTGYAGIVAAISEHLAVQRTNHQ